CSVLPLTVGAPGTIVRAGGMPLRREFFFFVSLAILAGCGGGGGGMTALSSPLPSTPLMGTQATPTPAPTGPAGFTLE
ncbi:MAG: hypothetical protein KGM44_01650, partial [bacterium]|nr:hypothetical protein [bacterium]